MTGYSKIKGLSTTKSRSIDFADINSFPESPKIVVVPSSKPQEPKQVSDLIKPKNPLEPFPEQEEHEDGQRFGVILNRSYSVSAVPRRLRAEKNNIRALQSGVRRVFSMRRSSSISDGYSKIHDQSSPACSPTDDDDDGMITMKTRSKKSKGKIFKACKKLFGL